MSKAGEAFGYSSAPPPCYDDNVMFEHPRPPPPSYEESQKNMNPMPMQFQQQPAVYGAPPAQPFFQQQQPQQLQPQAQPGGVVYNNNYMAPPQAAAASGYSVTAPGQVYLVGGMTNPTVIEFAKGAEMRTNKAGAVSVPPPPPGCAPTAAQLAAMQGQTVFVREPKKRGFF